MKHEEEIEKKYIEKTRTSNKIHKEIDGVIPGGVGSHIRWFEPYPFYLDRADGPYIWDVDGNRYVDYVMAWGPLLFGHRRPESVLKAVRRQAEEGLVYGIPYKTLGQVVDRIRRIIPSAKAVKLANTGTEAVMHAVRIARAFTGRKKILKFEGVFHGYSSEAWISVSPPPDKMGSYENPLPTPDCLGITEEQTSNYIISHWNDPEHFKKKLRENKDKLAAVLAIPVNTGLGVVPPEDNFLHILREETEKHDILLIFDEVTTGFRVSKAGGQGYYNVIPDISVFGKIIGGGMPIGIVCGREDVMDVTDPRKNIHPIAGTFTANPLSLVACNAMLQEIENDITLYDRLDKTTEYLSNQIQEILGTYNVDAVINRISSMFQIYFTGNKRIRNYRDTLTLNNKLYKTFLLAMINEGVFPNPKPLGRWYLSAAHTEEEVEQTIKTLEEVIREIAR